MGRRATAVPVPSTDSEDEVLLVVTMTTSYTIDPLDLLRFMAPRMAHFMVPRYIRVIAEMPRTPTAKIEKHRLKAAGVTTDTWDRETHGVTLRAGEFAWSAG